LWIAIGYYLRKALINIPNIPKKKKAARKGWKRMIAIYFVAGTRLSVGSEGARRAGSTALLQNMEYGIWNIDLLQGRAHTAQLEGQECLQQHV
jgi:hypothetical protein